MLDFIASQEVLRRVESTIVEAMTPRSQLQWSGHVIGIKNNHITVFQYTCTRQSKSRSSKEKIKDNLKEN